jgi:hypothetical protein
MAPSDDPSMRRRAGRLYDVGHPENWRWMTDVIEPPSLAA